MVARGAGRRNRLIKIQRRTVTKDSGGKVVHDTYTTLHPKVWASLIFRTGREGVQDNREVVTATYRFDCLYIDDVLNTDRVQYNNQYFTIETINSDSISNYTELMCTLKTGVVS